MANNSLPAETSIHKLYSPGDQIGPYTLLRLDTDAPDPYRWACRCVCGKETRLVIYQIIQRKDLSTCQGWHREYRLPKFYHERLIFQGIKQRCNNPKNDAFHNYGGRGIKCLFPSVAAFIAEVGPRPTPNHSVERINVNGHYEPGNIEWILQSKQALNTRQTNYITIDGVRKKRWQWAKEYGIAAKCIAARISVAKWCSKCAVTIPVREGHCPHRS
jgi:hypothetical protein